MASKKLLASGSEKAGETPSGICPSHVPSHTAIKAAGSEPPSSRRGGRISSPPPPSVLFANDDTPSNLPKAYVPRPTPPSIRAGELLRLGMKYARRVLERQGQIEDMRSDFAEKFRAMEPTEREDIYRWVYDTFQQDGKYDRHMQNAEPGYLGHYGAIRRTMLLQSRYLRMPMMDLSAGTGEPILYALNTIALPRIIGESMAAHYTAREGMRAEDVSPAADNVGRIMEEISRLHADIEFLFSQLPSRRQPQPIDREGHVVVVNELSQAMLESAKLKLSSNPLFPFIEFTNHSAYDMPSRYAGVFRTTLCCQTFNLLQPDDKIRMINAIGRSLVPRGIAMVIEEDKFEITPTTDIEDVGFFLSAMSCPIGKDALIASFENNGFRHIRSTAEEPVDSRPLHVMKCHIFLKREGISLSEDYTDRPACSSQE